MDQRNCMAMCESTGIWGSHLDRLMRFPCRKGFGTVLEVANRLVARLKEHGEQKPIDIDGALQCESFDVIGSVGFGHDFRATADLGGPGAVDCRTIKEGEFFRASLDVMLCSNQTLRFRYLSLMFRSTRCRNVKCRG